MRLDADTVKALIVALNFVPQDGKSGIYYKVYTSHGGYTIFVDFNREKFIYNADTNPKKSNITVWGKETSNFSQAENLVILECVNRLLEKGYAPSSIELEKVYPSGRGHSGRLDILVKAVNGTPFLMIECKTWGSEYEKERLKMAQNGGQLFNYYCDARATRHLCLYTSRMEAAIEYRNSIVDVEDAWAGLSEVKDIYGHWNKNFKDNGIFDGCSAPYDIRHRALTYGELKGLGGEDSGKIYNQIMEILRHNAISDKPNAFNKLLNLFVCKIVDEDKNADDELDFQWRESDTDETLQLRLNDLYKEGMWRFLEIQVIDYSQDDVAHRLANLDSTTKQWVMEMYTNTRLKKSPNFAFVEVQDERTFAHNAKVVREIVELLQVYKFRYAQRHEFLGNFFELLLNTSIKQEAGQYFTPVPIDRLLGDVRKGSYTYFRENDIIVAKITPCMENGKCALAVGLTNGIGMGSSEFHVFRCGDLVLPGYLFAFLNRASVREAAEAVMTGASGHRRVPIEFYRQLSIPLPPISEQRRIVAEIQQVEDQISLLNGQLNMLRMEKDAVLKKYL